MSRTTIDAGVLLHFVAGDHPERSPRCRDLFERVRNGDQTVYLPEAALCDAVRALRTLHRWPVGRVAAFTGDLLALDGVRMRRRDLVWNALSLFKDGDPDFSTALIAAEASAMGIGEICSYDRDLDATTGIERVEP